MPVIIGLACLTAMALTVVIFVLPEHGRWGRGMTRAKTTITPEMEREISNAWEASWSIERIRNLLRTKFGGWISDPKIYNAVSRSSQTR